MPTRNEITYSICFYWKHLKKIKTVEFKKFSDMARYLQNLWPLNPLAQSNCQITIYKKTNGTYSVIERLKGYSPPDKVRANHV